VGESNEQLWHVDKALLDFEKFMGGFSKEKHSQVYTDMARADVKAILDTNIRIKFRQGRKTPRIPKGEIWRLEAIGSHRTIWENGQRCIFFSWPEAEVRDGSILPVEGAAIPMRSTKEMGFVVRVGDTKSKEPDDYFVLRGHAVSRYMERCGYEGETYGGAVCMLSRLFRKWVRKKLGPEHELRISDNGVTQGGPVRFLETYIRHEVKNGLP
jgi:hypothetical protein